MKSFLSFVRTTLTGGILFLLPVAILFILFEKVFSILLKISTPISKILPKGDFWLDGSLTIAILLLVILCFASGLLFRSQKVKKLVSKLENDLLIYIPGYSLIKSVTADTIGEKIEDTLSPILIKDDKSWNFAFLVEERGEFSTIFIPDAPRYDAGEIKIVPSELVKKLNVPANIFTRSIKSYGKGALKWLEENDPKLNG